MPEETIEVEVGRIDQVPPYTNPPTYLCDGLVWDTIHTYHRIHFLVDQEWYWKFKDQRLPNQQRTVVQLEKWRILD